MKNISLTLDEIKSDYESLNKIVGDITTIEKAEEVLKEHPELIMVEINGEPIDIYKSSGGTDRDIEWIRYETYGVLDYIYCNIENNSIKDIRFDVWSNELEVDIIVDTYIDRLEEAYNAL